MMCDRLFQYVPENSILFEKQFGFQTAHNTEHAFLQIVNQFYQPFDNNKFKLGVFIDLSKAFNLVDRKILLRKLLVDRKILLRKLEL